MYQGLKTGSLFFRYLSSELQHCSLPLGIQVLLLIRQGLVCGLLLEKKFCLLNVHICLERYCKRCYFGSFCFFSCLLGEGENQYVHLLELYSKNASCLTPLCLFVFHQCLLGVAYSLLACALWPMVAFVVPEHQLGTAYGL